MIADVAPASVPNVQFGGRAEARHARRRSAMATPHLHRAYDAVSGPPQQRVLRRKRHPNKLQR
jgi:hypothetical protein